MCRRISAHAGAVSQDGPSGDTLPIAGWIHHGDPGLAPLGRSSAGTIMAILGSIHIGSLTAASPVGPVWKCPTASPPRHGSGRRRQACLPDAADSVPGGNWLGAGMDNQPWLLCPRSVVLPRESGARKAGCRRTSVHSGAGAQGGPSGDALPLRAARAATPRTPPARLSLCRSYSPIGSFARPRRMPAYLAGLIPWQCQAKALV